MSTNRMTRTAPLAAALLIGSGLLAGCHHDENAENAAVPPAATTAAPAETMPPAATSAMPMPSTMAPPASATVAPPSTAGDASAMAGNAASGPITDTAFYQDVLNDGQKEVAASKLAEKSASSKDVKDLAKMLAIDHAALDAKVKAAGGKDVTEPTTPADTSALEGKTGKDFDKAYVDAMVADHENAIAMFENASKNASTDKAKKLASDTLPALHKHLDAAQKLQSSLQ